MAFPPSTSSIFDIKEHVIGTAYIREYARATTTSQDEPLVQHVKQYIPKSNPNPRKGDVTIIGAHGNGFAKEQYEPLWEHLYLELQKQGIRIRQILMADCAWEGQSGVLNGDKLGNDPSWLDYMRDIVHMIGVFRPPPPLVGAGHSFGGAALVNAALFNPRLFHTLVLMDPVISRYASTPGEIKDGPAAMSIYRRDVWPTREAAVQSFKKSPFCLAWDPKVFDIWLQFGIVPAKTHSRFSQEPPEAYALTTTKHQEVFTYLRPSWTSFDAQGKTYQDRTRTPDLHLAFEGPGNKLNLTWPFYRAEPNSTLTKLPNLRPSTFYIFGGNSDLSPPDFIEEKLSTTGTGVGGNGGRAAGRVAGVTGQAGHLIPLEIPLFCAQNAAPWMKKELDRWAEEEKEYEEWTQNPLLEKTSISDEFAKYAGRPEKKPKGKAKL